MVKSENWLQAQALNLNPSFVVTEEMWVVNVPKEKIWGLPTFPKIRMFL